MITIKCELIKGGKMKKVIFFGLMLLMVDYAFAGQTIERYNFYNQYNPTSSIVYNQTNSNATGDQMAVNTYTRKTIQINPTTVNEDIRINIEGRSANQINSPAWAILSQVEFGSASSDANKQRAIDITQYVDFIRVGIKSVNGTSGNSLIDIEGIFTNLER